MLARPIDPEPTSAQQWESGLRSRVVQRFRQDIYGRAPDVDVDLSWRVLRDGDAGGRARSRQLALTFHGPRGQTTITLLIHLPRSQAPVPALLGLNFRGNHAASKDPEVLVAGIEEPAQTGAVHYDGLHGVEGFELAPPRGSKAHRWPLPLATGRGYAVITACYLQLGPDTPEIFGTGLNASLVEEAWHREEPDRWGAISIWAWTLRRIMDAIEHGMVPEIAPSKVALLGHSRLGKTALWAAAQDHRFAAVISNNSGCMGAAQSRPVGETPEVLARVRPHWFAPAFASTVLGGDPLPVDQHQLLTCAAPRPLYVASASEDHNADPEGEFRSLQLASSVWERYGHGPMTGDYPAPGQQALAHGAPLGFHLRSGPHEVFPFDWERWLDFLDAWL